MSINNSKQDLEHIDFVPGPVLHQDGETLTEVESVLFEKDNPKIIAYLQSLKHKLNSILEGK